MTKTRLEAFSDGVFSIIITLLILDVRIPDKESITNHELNQLIRGVTPNILTYFFTFLVVGVFWVAHQRIFSFVHSVDSTLLWVNTVYLMFNALIPFPASILAKHPTLPSSVLFYTGTLFLIGAIHFVFLGLISKKQHLMHPGFDNSLLKLSAKIALVGPLCYITAAAVSFISVYLSFCFIIGALVYYIFFSGRSRLGRKLSGKPG
jgi:uncharacterized membrane protein